MRDDSPWDGEGFRLKKNPCTVPGSPEKRKNERNTQKLATTATWLYTAYVVMVLYHTPHIKTTTGVVAKPLVIDKSIHGNGMVANNLLHFIVTNQK